MPKVTLVSSDSKSFDVDVKVANMSKLIKEMHQLDIGDGDGEEIPVANVRGDVLEKVVDWATHHVDDTEEDFDDETKEKRTDDISQWDLEFMKVEKTMVFEIILAANFLDMRGLLNLGCKTVANMIKPIMTDPEAIRKMFNITNDYTPEEEEQVRKENAWCEEK